MSTVGDNKYWKRIKILYGILIASLSLLVLIVVNAHSRGIAHLDLKPENILFRHPDDGWPVPKIADWGLAQAMLDTDGELEGFSAQYAAPEQIDSQRFGTPNQSTDIYQLGTIFYEMFTGRPPHQGAGGDVLTKIVEDEITPPSEHDPSLPAALDEVLLRALARQKSDRYESVLYLRDALAECDEELVTS